MTDDKKGARSYKSEVIGDSMALTINFKWLIQLLVFVAMLGYGWWQLESRIQALERNMGETTEQVEFLNEERRLAEKRHKEELKEELSLLKTELNINPFSWGKEEMNNRLNDKTSLNISLPMIIQIVSFISAMVWGYSQLTSRIAFVENQSERNGQYIDEMKALQDAPIPSDVRQDELIRVLTSTINGIEDDLEYIKRNIYNK